MFDLHNNIHPVRGISPQNINTSATHNGTIVDILGYQSLEFVLAMGSLADVNATFTVRVQHGDTADLSDAVNVPDSFLIGTEAEASFDFSNDNELRKIGYIGDKRYVRLVLTSAGNTGDAFISVIAILGDPRHAPTPSLS